MIAAFLKKVFLVDIIQGMLVTLKMTFSPKVTIQFPEKVKEPRARFRGIIRLYRDDAGEPLCIACKLCQKTCPENCFDIEGQKSEGAKMRPVKFEWKLQRCTFCGLCVEVCPTSAIRFSREFRLSTYDRSRLLFHLDTMYYDLDLQKYLHEDGDTE